MSVRANLRVCCSCEWVFRRDKSDGTCFHCGWPSYGARYVYGDRAYVYEKTQAPWKKRKMDALSFELDDIIRQHQPTSKETFP